MSINLDAMLMIFRCLAGILALCLAVPTGGVEAQPAGGAQQVRVTIDFEPKTSRTPVPFEVVNGLVVFRAEVAGEMTWAMLDNRAENSVIDVTYAKRRGVKIGAESGSFTTVAGSVRTNRASDVAVAIPKQLRFRAPFVAADLTPFARAAGRDIALIVGKEIFDNMVIEIDPRRRWFRIGPSGAAQAGARAPLVPLIDGRPRVAVVVGDQEFTLTIDGGYGGSLVLTPDAWSRLRNAPPPTERRQMIGVDGKPRAVVGAILPQIKLGALQVEKVPVTIAPVLAADGDGYVGMDLLLRYHILLDVKARKLWLLPFADQ